MSEKTIPVVAQSNDQLREQIAAKGTIQRRPGATPDTFYGRDDAGYLHIKVLPNSKNKSSETSQANNDQELVTRLTNFLPRITTQRVIIEDDCPIDREYVIEICINGRTRRFTLPAEQFLEMKWPERYVGVSAVIYPKMFNFKEHTATAIKLFSDPIPTINMLRHPGWTRTPRGWAFAHASGVSFPVVQGPPVPPPNEDDAPTRTAASRDTAGTSESLGPPGPPFGGEESPTYVTDFQEAYRRVDLLAPFWGKELVEGIEAVLDLLDTAPTSITVPLLGIVLHAPLGAPRTYVNLVGGSDSGKSVLAGLFQSFFGPEFDSRNFLAHWGSTANCLERQLYNSNGFAVVIDDFLTKGQSGEIHRQQAKADQVLRGLYNNSGRGRAQGDGEIRESKPPRGDVISTAEVPFDGLSIRNRGFNLDFLRKDVCWEKVTKAQENARRGVFARVMNSYLCIVASRYDELQEWKLKIKQQYENRARAELIGRGRAAEVAATLITGLNLMCMILHQMKAISESDRDEYVKEFWQALIEAAQSHPVEQDDPLEFFFQCLRTAFITGKAHLEDPEGGRPNALIDFFSTEPRAWGWYRFSNEDEVKQFNQASDSDDSENSVTVKKVAVTSGWRARGETVGWLSASYLFLDTMASLRAAKAIARSIDATIDFNEETLGRALFERGLLLKSDHKHKNPRYTHRENLGGSRKRALHLLISVLFPPLATDPAFCRMHDCEEDEIPDIMLRFEQLLE